MSKELIFCLHCQTQTNLTSDNFSRCHLKKEHNMTVQEYYDLYLKKDENEGICVTCGKPTKFENMNKGYRERCSKECLRIDLRNKNSKVIKKIKKTRKENVNEEEALLKRKQTCLDKYGTEIVSQNEKVKNKMFETNIERYGEKTTLNLRQVKSARIISLKDNSEKINQKRKNWWTYENIQKVNKTRIFTLLEKYGVTNLFSTDEMKEIIKHTNNEKYGVDYIVESQHFKNIMIEKGYWTPLENKNEWDKYCYYVNIETKIHLPKLFQNWNGKCYYFGHELSNKNGTYDPYSITIDHKISKKYGFINNVDPKIIGNIDNLCVCSRLINCIKNSLTEEQFYESDRYLKYKESLCRKI